MSKTMILDLGTGESRGVVGVKTAKLCVKQDQIGKRFHRKVDKVVCNCFRVRSLELKGNDGPRGMVIDTSKGT